MSILKPQVIIIEGPDRCGKGTFIESIKNTILNSNIIHIHSSAPPKALDNNKKVLWSTEYNINLIDNVNILSKTNDIIILDRSYIGEYVYGTLYRNAEYTEDDFIEFEKEYLDIDNINFSLINFKDNVNDLIIREDGKSASSFFHDKAKELKQIEIDMFDNLHKLSIVKYKKTIDWSDDENTFSTDFLDKLAKEVLIGNFELRKGYNL